MIAVNKVEGENQTRAKQAAVYDRNALKITKHTSPNRTPPVMLFSALQGIALETL